MDIQYLDGDSLPSRTSQAPKYEQPPPPPVNPNAPKWYRCDNTECSQCGCVATASPRVVEKLKVRRCHNEFCVAGFDQSTQLTCETCEGRGKIQEVIDTQEFNPTCGFCNRPMRFMQQGPMPAGHQRMSGPEYGGAETGSRRISVS